MWWHSRVVACGEPARQSDRMVVYVQVLAQALSPNVNAHMFRRILVPGDAGVSLFLCDGDAFGTARAASRP